MVAQDPSKSLQAQVNFRAETFASYRVNASAAGTQGHVSGVGSAVGTFGLDLGSLIDVLNAFAPLDGECELSMRWPDRDNSLVLAALTVRDAADPHAGRPARMCTHASIAPEVDGWSTTSAADAELVFRGERNAFAMPTTALREIVDDLEWPCAPMTIAMSSHPSPSLSFSSKGKDTGELRIDVDATPGSSGADGVFVRRIRGVDVPVQVHESRGVVASPGARRSRARARGGRVADDDARGDRRGRRRQDRAPGAHEQGSARERRRASSSSLGGIRRLAAVRRWGWDARDGWDGGARGDARGWDAGSGELRGARDVRGVRGG